ncbi:MAG: polysaccharide export protein [Gemmatimonadetes bacterium]|nr:polysaccharide export protein [Gemmatimonadota bacterium]
MKRTVAWLLLLLLALPYAPVRAQASDPDPESLSLQPGDLVRVKIYREKDLDGDFLVRNDGVVVLPLIGEQRVTGVSIRDLRTRLVEAYRAQLRNPSIDITPLRRIHILGEVQKPGLYPIDPTVSLAGAIALASGTTPNGDLRRVRIIRDGREIRKGVGLAETITSADIHSGDQVIVDQRSWFNRNSTFLVSGLLSVTSIITSIIISRRN